MIATKARHRLGDLSRDVPDLAVIFNETDEAYIGRWKFGFGFDNVEFPKETTRPLTAEEKAYYESQAVELGGQVYPIVIED